MSASSVRHIPWESIPIEELNPLLSRRLVTGEKGMLAHVYLKRVRLFRYIRTRTNNLPISSKGHLNS